MTPTPAPRLTPAQRRMLVALVLLVAVLAGLVGYGLGFHDMTVAALLDNAVQAVSGAIFSLLLTWSRR